ncbi:MAG TPA: MarR family winged helix-turn-helix transcriptional regulator [Trebonia sp.]|jgi:DNA-binding MarR family transcriptional regulator|nr:MarR family winged helix-turn-helix transcriptional regulator [Trebonia sp.]
MPQGPAESAMADAAPAARSWRADSIGYLVWRSHLLFRRALDTALAEMGVNIAQVGIADELIEHGPRSVADLARVLGVTPQGAALAASQLRTLGWVTPRPASGRGRAVLLEITAAGRENHRRAARIIEHIDDSLTGGITAAERAAATAALRAIAGTTAPPQA